MTKHEQHEALVEAVAKRLSSSEYFEPNTGNWEIDHGHEVFRAIARKKARAVLAIVAESLETATVAMQKAWLTRHAEAKKSETYYEQMTADWLAMLRASPLHEGGADE